MPNDDHVAALGRDAAAWNTWRAESGETPDLSRAGLRGLDLSGFDLSQADLRHDQQCRVAIWTTPRSMICCSPGVPELLKSEGEPVPVGVIRGASWQFDYLSADLF